VRENARKYKKPTLEPSVQGLQSEINRLLVFTAGALLLGVFLGNVFLVLFIGSSAYIVFTLSQLLRLKNWLSQDHSYSDANPPESIGLWGEIFDGIYRLQKQKRKASHHLESIINKAQESSAALEMAVVMINKHGNLDWWNLASEKLLGLQHPQDQNQSVTNLIRDPAFADYFQQKEYANTLKIASANNSSRTLEFQIALFGEQERLMIVRDITQIQKLESMRKDFIGNVSHELGTPITVIKGYIEAILDNSQELQSRWQKPLQQMQQQSERMENIVKDLLVLSSLETESIGTQHGDAIQIGILLQEIMGDVEQMFTDKSQHFELSIESDAIVQGDKAELYSAFSNLIVNAGKYTPSGGHIKVHCEQDEEGLRVRFSDDGIGIEQHHIPRLTERFYRVDVSRSTETGGTGLGLAIVKHILARHDAQLSISSNPGRGSSFTCLFPSSQFLPPNVSHATPENNALDDDSNRDSLAISENRV